ncbi:hypothetical protein GN958_ATG14867 [Phytophthora infestans]|uniref:Uncharacterized protein n=1 Tax=Phytophthora infestans TaxID=4787 RepID=A0A8S9U4I7_PHYIN|nr:hypothetical protein GN958_ATG14867 [Phytophthora infestans]
MTSADDSVSEANKPSLEPGEASREVSAVNDEGNYLNPRLATLEQHLVWRQRETTPHPIQRRSQMKPHNRRRRQPRESNRDGRTASRSDCTAASIVTTEAFQSLPAGTQSNRSRKIARMDGSKTSCS